MNQLYLFLISPDVAKKKHWTKLDTLRIMGSQNWWFGDPRTVPYRVKPLHRRVQWFLGYTRIEGNRLADVRVRAQISNIFSPENSPKNTHGILVPAEKKHTKEFVRDFTLTTQWFGRFWGSKTLPIREIDHPDRSLPRSLPQYHSLAILSIPFLVGVSQKHLHLPLESWEGATSEKYSKKHTMGNPVIEKLSVQVPRPR